MADTDPLVYSHSRKPIECRSREEAPPPWVVPIYYNRGIRPARPFQCERHDVTVLRGAEGVCEQCLAMLDRDPACMTGDERADETRYWCEQVWLTIGHSFIWKRIDALAGRPTGIHEPALAAEGLIEEARGTRRLNSSHEALNDLRSTGQFEVVDDDEVVVAWGEGPLSPRPGGLHVKLDPDDLPNGLYLVRFTTGAQYGETIRCQLTRGDGYWSVDFI